MKDETTKAPEATTNANVGVAEVIRGYLGVSPGGKLMVHPMPGSTEDEVAAAAQQWANRHKRDCAVFRTVGVVGPVQEVQVRPLD